MTGKYGKLAGARTPESPTSGTLEQQKTGTPEAQDSGIQERQNTAVQDQQISGIPAQKNSAEPEKTKFSTLLLSDTARRLRVLAAQRGMKDWQVAEAAIWEYLERNGG